MSNSLFSHGELGEVEKMNAKRQLHQTMTGYLDGKSPPKSLKDAEIMVKDWLGRYDEAFRDLDRVAIERLVDELQATLYFANGESRVGAFDVDGVGSTLAKKLAAKRGKRPLWGQPGEWTAKVFGVPMLFRTRGILSAGYSCLRTQIPPFETARVAENPHLSPTGFRSFIIGLIPRAETVEGGKLGDPASVYLYIAQDFIRTVESGWLFDTKGQKCNRIPAHKLARN